jgi:hypothetical protein
MRSVKFETGGDEQLSCLALFLDLNCSSKLYHA